MSDDREILNLRQAAAHLGISADTLYKYIAERKLPAFKLGNRWRFSRTALNDWVEQEIYAQTHGFRS